MPAQKKAAPAKKSAPTKKVAPAKKPAPAKKSPPAGEVVVEAAPVVETKVEEKAADPAQFYMEDDSEPVAMMQADRLGKPIAAPEDTPKSQYDMHTIELASRAMNLGSHGARISILEFLDQPLGWTVTQMCRALKSNQPGISHQLSILRNSGMVRPVRAGKRTVYVLTDNGAKLLEAFKGLIRITG